MKPLLRHTVFAALSCLAFATSARAADDPAAVCKAVTDGFSAGVVSGNSTNVGAVFAPGGEAVSGYGILTGPEAITKAYAAFVKPGATHADTVMSARAVGDVVICSGGWTMGSPAFPAPIKGFYTKVVGKVGSEWKILVLTSNVIPPT
jgi:uncharacterized 2Fe-2S/4Fe-4S cluster protein (DUF4445 family)